MTRARDLSKIVNNKMTVFKYTATASQTTFTGADDNSATLSYNPNSIIVTYNGIVLENVSEYTATNGTSVVLATGATVGSEVNIIAFEDLAYSGVMPTTGGTFTGNVNVNGNVGVGTSSPDRNLHVKKTDTGGTVAKFENSAGSSFIEMASSAGGGANGGYIEYNATKDFKFAPGDTNRMVIKADGKVGIGIEAPQAPLHIEAPDNSELMNFTVTGNERWALRGESGSGSNDFLGLGIAGGVQAMYWNEAGEVQAPSQPSFYAYPTTASTSILANSSWQVLPFNAVGWDIGNNYDTTNKRFTAPVAGRYLFTWMCQLENANTVTWAYLYPSVNGSRAQNRGKGVSYSDFKMQPNYHTEQGAWIMNLAAGDYISLDYIGSGSAKDFKTESHWTGILLS
jgi:hypothetical protein|tara:strand:- start:1857 stop:3047 length:1191 start_codon:yes stop_codon:yes gene_type:complete